LLLDAIKLTNEIRAFSLALQVVKLHLRSGYKLYILLPISHKLVDIYRINY